MNSDHPTIFITVEIYIETISDGQKFMKQGQSISWPMVYTAGSDTVYGQLYELFSSARKDLEKHLSEIR